MADAKQLALLAQGVEAWNRWRKENPRVQINLQCADLKHMHLENANLANADLTNANLSFSHLKKANLVFANLKNAILSFTNFDGANLSAANLKNVHIEDATLKGAILTSANLKNALLTNSNLKNANLVDAHLVGTNLIAVNFENANLSSVIFDQNIMGKLIRETGCRPQKLWNRRYDLLLDTKIRCKGVNATTCYGSQRFKLFLQDQDFFEEFLETTRGKKIFIIWWVFADCGRSVGRWAGWSLFFALCFALIFWLLGSHSFHTEYLDFNFMTLFYYSVVTFTTLGFGDIIPKNSTAAICVTVEVILGYIMLGGLITIFASKLARRGG